MKYFEEGVLQVGIHRSSEGHILVNMFCEDQDFLTSLRDILRDGFFIDEVANNIGIPGLTIGRHKQKDENHAIKIVNERRVAMIASGE